MKKWWYFSKTDVKPDNPNSSYIRGPQGAYTFSPNAYLNAKKDTVLQPKVKNPWDQ